MLTRHAVYILSAILALFSIGLRPAFATSGSSLGSSGTFIQLTSDPQIGDHVITDVESFGLLAASGSQTYAGYQAVHENVEYALGLDASDRIAYISVSDRDFVTPDGVRLGDSLPQALTCSDSGIREEPGWAWLIDLRSGWVAHVGRVEVIGDSLSMVVIPSPGIELPSNAYVVSFSNPDYS